MITILTTAYNRKHTLPRTYESLLRQTDFDFEWVVIDDGSTDGTESIVRDWMGNGEFPIVYKYKNNGGMHTAMNAGIEIAQGELILKLDSDDYLAEDAVATVKRDWETVKDNPSVGGVAYLNAYHGTGEIIGNAFRNNRSIRSLLQMRFYDRIRGDKTEVIRTDIYRVFPYPVFEGERRSSTSIVHVRMSTSGYRFLLVNKIIKYMEYLEDGVSKNLPFTPNADCIQYNEQTTGEFPLGVRWRSMRRYIRSCKKAKKSFKSSYRESHTKPLFLLVFILHPWLWLSN